MPTRTTSAINGVYRWEFTREELEAAGLPRDQVDGNVGVWTNRFEDGRRWNEERVMGTYVLDGDLMTITHWDGVVDLSVGAERTGRTCW